MCPYKFYYSINLVTQRLGDLVTQKALGIGAASFWSVSGKRYSGKPDGDSRNAQIKLKIEN